MNQMRKRSKLEYIDYSLHQQYESYMIKMKRICFILSFYKLFGMKSFQIIFANDNLSHKIFHFLLIIIYLMKNDSRSREDNVRSTGANFYNEERPISQIQIEQKCVHLQTVLLLTQLNSAYFQMQISLQKALTNLEQKYISIKMKAFLRMKNSKRNFYEAKFKENFNNCLDSINIDPTSQQSIGNKASQKTKQKQSIIILHDLETTKSILFLKTRGILNRFALKIKNKKANLLAVAFYRVLNYSKQSSVLRMPSDKPSKIDTNDSQKSEVNKSKQRREYRRLYSLQKSKANYRSQQKNPAQNNRQTPQLSSNISSIDTESKINKYGSQLNKLLQKNAESLQNERKNRFSLNRDRLNLRSKSRKKQAASLIINDKQQKIIELQLLKRKYHKLISQFNNFSQKFLRVIEEQDCK